MSAIRRAGEATGEFDDDESALLTNQVTKVLRHRFSKGVLPTIEQIQDVVEQVLISANYYKTARAYIVYRESRSKSRQDKKRWLTLRLRSTNIWNGRTGASTRTPIRDILWAV